MSCRDYGASAANAMADGYHDISEEKAVFRREASKAVDTSRATKYVHQADSDAMICLWRGGGDGPEVRHRNPSKLRIWTERAAICLCVVVCIVVAAKLLGMPQ